MELGGEDIRPERLAHLKEIGKSRPGAITADLAPGSDLAIAMENVSWGQMGYQGVDDGPRHLLDSIREYLKGSL